MVLIIVSLIHLLLFVVYSVKYNYVLCLKELYVLWSPDLRFLVHLHRYLRICWGPFSASAVWETQVFII